MYFIGGKMKKWIINHQKITSIMFTFLILFVLYSLIYVVEYVSSNFFEYETVIWGIYVYSLLIIFLIGLYSICRNIIRKISNKFYKEV